MRDSVKQKLFLKRVSKKCGGGEQYNWANFFDDCLNHDFAIFHGVAQMLLRFATILRLCHPARTAIGVKNE